MVSIPASSSSCFALTSENLDTPITLFLLPASLIASTANLPMLTPIFPPIPKSMISPSIFKISLISASDGLIKSASNCCKSFILILIYTFNLFYKEIIAIADSQGYYKQQSNTPKYFYEKAVFSISHNLPIICYRIHCVANERNQEYGYTLRHYN